MCERKDKTGSCGCYQCPFSDVTSHGRECVDLASDDTRQYCEVGLNCLPVCPHSFTIIQIEEAEAAFAVKLNG